MQDVITIIQTVGFPIACAVAMFLMLQNEQKAHKEESEKLTQTITDLKINFSEAVHDQERTIAEVILSGIRLRLKMPPVRLSGME